MNRFVSDALSYSLKNNLFCKGDSIVVALSGGADSVALLAFFKEIEEEYQIKLSSFHLNHMLRGDEALRDERFAEEISNSLSVPFSSVSVDIKEMAKREKIGTEEAGRKARYSHLSALGRDKIATAHNKNDLAETFFINLCRGSSSAGLASIPPKRRNIIRPLLNQSREEIERYLEERGLRFVTDGTNSQDIYLRNRIRHSVIPNLLDISPDFLQKIAKTTELISEDERYLSGIAQELIEDNSIDIKKLNSNSFSIASRAVRLLLQKNKAPFDSIKIELILESAKKGSGAVNINGDIFCQIYDKKLFVTEKKPKNNNILTVKGFSDIVFSNKQVKFIETEKKNIDNKLLRYAISCDKIIGALSVRSRREGDLFQYPNRKGTKTLKKLFNELRIPKWERDDIIVIADEEGVLWVEGIGVSSRAFGGDRLIQVEIIGVENNG